MATRRAFSSYGVSQPASPMTPHGGSGTMYDQDEHAQMLPQESPDTFRRRTTPLTDTPSPQMNPLQELLSMLTEGR